MDTLVLEVKMISFFQFNSRKNSFLVKTKYIKNILRNLSKRTMNIEYNDLI